MVTVVFGNIEIYRSGTFIGISAFKNFLYVLDLLYDVSGGMRLYRRRKHVERLHGLVVAVEVVLHHFHGLKLFEPGFLGHFVLTVVGIMFEMAYIGDIAHISHLVA